MELIWKRIGKFIMNNVFLNKLKILKDNPYILFIMPWLKRLGKKLFYLLIFFGGIIISMAFGAILSAVDWYQYCANRIFHYRNHNDR